MGNNPEKEMKIDINRITQKINRIRDNYANVKGKADIMLSEAVIEAMKGVIDEVAPLVTLVNQLQTKNKALQAEVDRLTPKMESPKDGDPKKEQDSSETKKPEAVASGESPKDPKKK